jgi:hypothetical protein
MRKAASSVGTRTQTPVLPDLSRMLAEVGDGGEFTWVKVAGHDIDLTRPDVTEQTIDAIWEKAI